MAFDGTGVIAAADLPYRDSLSAGLSGPLAGANKLWLPIWSGEVIHAYDEYNTFEQFVQAKTLSSGVAMEFPITGTVALKASWEAGAELGGGSDSSSTTIAIKLDKRPMAAHFEIDNIDLMQTQWEFRSELARQAGMTLANARDKQIAAYIARAGAEDLTFNTGWTGDGDPATSTLSTLDPRALSTGPVFLNPMFYHLGNSASAADVRNTAALGVLASIEDFFIYLATINAATDGVVCAVTPRAFSDIRSLGVARDNAGLFGAASSRGPMFGGVAEAGGLGAQLTMGMHGLSDALEYQGCMIVKSNHLPIANLSTGAIGEARYCLAFGDTGVCGMIFQKGCVASLKLQGLKVDTIDDVRRNTVFTVASMLAGTGVLKPECAALLIKPTASNWVITTTPSEASYGAATSSAPTAANFFYGPTDFTTTTGMAVATILVGANAGGEAAAKARFGLRCNFGSNFSREYLATGTGVATPGFPYA